MKMPERLSRLIVLAVTLAVMGSASVATATFAMVSSVADEKIEWADPQANQASYWEDYFGPGWTCEKFDESGDFQTDYAYGAIVIKAGQFNYIWKPAPVGHYTTPQGVSHYFLCNGHKPPPKPEPEPEPWVKINVACVAHNSGGERKVVQTRVTYGTDGVQMVLHRRIVIDGQLRLNNYMDVWGDGLTLTSYRKVGYGNHRVNVEVVLGGEKFVKTKTVHCDREPVVQILGPCGDPMYGVRVWNRTWASQRLVVMLGERVIANRWVTRSALYIYGPFYAPPGERIKVYLNGKLKKSEVAAPGGYYGWGSKECRVLRAGVQTA